MAITLKTKLQSVGITGTQLYLTRPVAYNTIKEKELAQRIQTNTGISNAMVRAAFDAIVLTMKEQVLNGHQVEFGDLGYIRLSISCKSCEESKDISCKNVKRRRLLFTPKTEFRQAMKSTPLRIVCDPSVKKKTTNEEDESNG